jgi:hypothetical protein
MDDRNDRRSKSNMSWSEIDKIRDKSQRRDRDPGLKQSSPQMITAQKNYRAALEKAFAAGTLGELAQKLSRTTVDDTRPAAGQTRAATPPPAAAAAQPVEAAAPPAAEEQASAPAAIPKDPERENRQKMLAKIREAEGRDPITRAVDTFLAKYPKLPDDFEVLTKALSHKSDDRVRATLDQLTTLCGKEKPRRGRALIAQLRILEDTHSDGEIRTIAAQVRGRL